MMLLSTEVEKRGNTNDTLQLNSQSKPQRQPTGGQMITRLIRRTPGVRRSSWKDAWYESGTIRTIIQAIRQFIRCDRKTGADDRLEQARVLITRTKSPWFAFNPDYGS